MYFRSEETSVNGKIHMYLTDTLGYTSFGKVTHKKAASSDTPYLYQNLKSRSAIQPSAYERNMAHVSQHIVSCAEFVYLNTHCNIMIHDVAHHDT